ncbi:MAG: cysteine--tRNA ligase [Thermoplasmata archaeon]|nr:cysteine--tRNA ligase [Thermoplasmata archaeon]
MALRVYDTRRREKVDFVTIEAGKVRMYVCGITPYSPSHLGHARCYIAFDIVHRWLEAKGYDVTYVQNFTDVEDKIINIANEEGIDYLEVAERNIVDYYDVMDALNVLRADHYPRVTETIEGIISMIETLIEKEHAYNGEDGVYFHVESAPEKYGLLTGQNIEAVRAGAGGRVGGTGLGKRDHKDFALWKFAKPGEPQWDSPWGAGRPGWHIECSAMSLQYFGEQFDIHGGGDDLRFPHHEAEIFQSECCTGKSPLVNHWMHNGFVNIDGEKMSKSLGNFWTITDALKTHKPLVLRHALLNAHYRNPIDFSEQFLEDGKRSQNKLEDSYCDLLRVWGEKNKDHLVSLPRPQLGGEGLAHTIGMLEKLGEECALSMDDDFNTREALAKISSAIKIMNKAVNSDIDENDRQSLGYYCVEWLEEFAGSALGLLPSREDALAGSQEDPRRAELEPIVSELLMKRAAAREAKDWEAADAIRSELAALGITVQDTADGPEWEIN